jgi:hypothetical protein
VVRGSGRVYAEAMEIGRAMYYDTRSRALVCCGFPLALVAIFAVAGRGGPAPTGGSLGPAVAGCAFFLGIGLLNFLLTGGHKIDLDPEGLTIRRGPRGAWRWKRILWDDVAAVEPVRNGVRIWTGPTWEGAWMPRGLGLSADDYVGTVTQWWQRYGRPPPPD